MSQGPGAADLRAYVILTVVAAATAFLITVALVLSPDAGASPLASQGTGKCPAAPVGGGVVPVSCSEVHASFGRPLSAASGPSSDLDGSRAIP